MQGAATRRSCSLSLRGHLYLLGSTLAGRFGVSPKPMVIFSSIEERNDRTGHHLEPVLALTADEKRLGLDLWLPLFSELARPYPMLFVAVWATFALNAIALVHFRRRLWREIRRAESEPRIP